MKNNPEAIAMIALGALFVCANYMVLKVASLQYFSLRNENSHVEAWRNYEN